MTGRTTAASLVVSVCLVMAVLAGGLPLASGPAVAQSGSLNLQDDIREEDDFVVDITNLDGIGAAYLVVENLDNGQGTFEITVEDGDQEVLSAEHIGSLDAGDRVEATLYESQAKDVELDRERTSVSGFTGSFEQSIYSATQGDTVEFGVTVSNPGDAQTTETVTLVLDNNIGPVESRTVTVAGGGSKQFRMTWNTSGSDAGSYDARLVSQYDSDELALAVVDLTQADPANFDVAIESTNAPVTEGDPLDVRVTVSNTGDKSDTQNVTLAVNNAIEDARTLTLDGGASETFTLTWQTQRGDAGTHLAEVASADSGAERDIVVEQPAPANFAVSLDSTTAPVTEGERLDVTATITNTGEEPGSQDVDLVIDGTSVDSTPVSLAGGGSTTVTLSWQTGSGDAGSHEAAVSSANETADTVVEVEEETPPFFRVRLDATNSPVTAGASLDVTATITNVGDRSDTLGIALTIDGNRVDSTADTLASGESSTVTLSWLTGTGDAGEHTATVASPNESDGTTVKVLQQDTPTPTQTPTDRPTQTPTDTTTDTPTDTPTATPTDATSETTTPGPTATAATTTVEAGAGEGTQEQRRWDVEIESTTSPVNAGDRLRVTATLTNLGEDFASTELILSVGSDQADVRAMSLAGGAAETVTLIWEPGSGDAGDYTALVAAGEESDDEPVEVRDADDPVFDVEIESTTPPAETANESLVVTARVRNTGASRDRQEVRLAIGGVEQDSETVELAAGASRTLSFTWDPQEFDETTIEVASEDDDATVAVAPGDGGGNPLSDPLLIGVLLLLLALAVAGYYYVRRQQLHRGQGA